MIEIVVGTVGGVFTKDVVVTLFLMQTAMIAVMVTVIGVVVVAMADVIARHTVVMVIAHVVETARSMTTPRPLPGLSCTQRP